MPRTVRLTAFNTATESTNKIHDDEVARQLGFRGGLVPGVDVYAYLCQPPVEAWGRSWLERGTLRARFHQPVYDGDPITVEMSGNGSLEVRDSAGQRCAAGVATLPETPAPAADPDHWPDVAPVVDRPVAAPEVLVPGTALGIEPHHFLAERAGDYLADVRATTPLYPDERIAHPAWILRDANYVLSSNVRLGPWIHVESVVQHHAVVEDGQTVSARGLVTAEWEHKGHRFVSIDVLHLADGRPVARTAHTAIYRPRGT